MPAGVFDFPINQGETFYYKIQLFGENQDEVIDLTNFTAEMQIRKTANDNEILVSPEIKIEDAKNGIISIFLSAEETAKLPCTGKYFNQYLDLVYDIYISSKGYEDKDYRIRILNGLIKVSPYVTRLKNG